MARAYVQLHINGRPHRVTGGDALLSLSDFLRIRLGLIATKIVCSEGDCGACSVLVARSNTTGEKYVPVDACITWMFQLDGASVITAEGLRDGDELHPVQRAMIQGHGSQCGFCTPGFVTTMAGLAEDARAAGLEAVGECELRRGLTGNLCRCTGYSQIIEAGRAMDLRAGESLLERYPIPALGDTKEGNAVSVKMEGSTGGELFIPSNLAEAVAFIAANCDAKIVAGATDVGVQINKGLMAFAKVLYIGGLSELKQIRIADGRLTVGAGSTWWEVAQAVREHLPQFVAIIDRFGAPQIRHAATIGGNIINASPIADSLPFLYVTDAKLRLIGASGQRSVKMIDFIRGYKKLDLLPGEILVDIELTLPTAAQSLLLYKVSKRRDLDISTFTAAMLFTMNTGRIEEARIAYGGVGPVVLRLPRSESFLRGRELTEQLMIDAGAIAQSEITPITDVRASADYRSELAATILLKAYHELAETLVISG